MTKSIEEAEQFIQLRAKGLSFDKIAEQTGISKPTLLKWQKSYNKEIDEAMFFELQNTLEQYQVMRKNRVEVIAELLASALGEMKQRAGSQSLTRLPTDKLVSLVLTLEERLQKETESRTLEYSSARDMEYLLSSFVSPD